MMNNARATYLDATVATASPARLLVMLFDRLVLDVQRGLDAQRGGVFDEAHKQFIHAQDILLELQVSLRPDEFTGGAELADLYGFLHRQLVQANIRRDPAITEDVLTLVTELSDTWRQAAMLAAAPAPVAKGA